GFMDCRPASHELYFPNLQHVTVPTIWDALGARGKRSVLLNVPGTYPARPTPGGGAGPPRQARGPAQRPRPLPGAADPGCAGLRVGGAEPRPLGSPAPAA